jgi:phosphomannomutase
LYEPGALMISVSGVRGRLGGGMNPEVAARFTAAYASHIRSGPVIVGRDTRPSGPLLASTVFSALRFKGLTAIDLGVASTPTVELMVQELAAAGGIIITASHNGPEWNALKFLGSDGEFLSGEEIERLKELVTSGESLFDAPGDMGLLESNDSGDDVHIRRILELERIDRGRIAKAGLRAVVDCVNGAGSRIVPALLKRLGVSVVELFTDIGALGCG